MVRAQALGITSRSEERAEGVNATRDSGLGGVENVMISKLASKHRSKAPSYLTRVLVANTAPLGEMATL